MAILGKRKAKKSKEKLLKELVEERDLAVQYRKDVGWDSRYTNAWNYYYFGTEVDVREVEGNKKKRKANYVFSNIEAIIPKMFDRFPSFQVFPTGPDDVKKAPKLEKILKHKLQDQDIEEKWEGMARDMLVPSMGVMKITWDVDFQENKKAKDDEDKIESVSKDDLDICVIDSQNFWVTAGDHRLEKARGCFEKMMLTKKEAKDTYGKDLEARAFVVKDDKTGEKTKAERVIVWRYEGKMKGKDMVWEFIDDEILREEERYEHGRFPYVLLPNYRSSQEFYPWSEVYNIEPLQEELLQIDNQFTEWRKRCVNPKKIVKKGNMDTINLERLKNPKINVIEAIDPSAIQWENPPMIGQDLYNIRAAKKEDIGLMTGQSEISRGGTERVVKTATGQQILFDAAQARVRQKVRAMERAIKEMLIQIQGLMAEFQDGEEFVRVDEDSENPFEGYTKEDIQGNFDYKIDMVESAPLLRDKRAQVALDFYDRFKDDPDVDQKALKKKTIKLAYSDINAEDLIMDDEKKEMMEDIPLEGLPQIPQVPLAPPMPQGIPQGPLTPQF